MKKTLFVMALAMVLVFAFSGVAMAKITNGYVTWDQAMKSDLDLAPTRFAWNAEMKVKPGPDGLYPCSIPGVTKAL